MRAALFGLINLVNEREKPELNAGALHRFLAESLWFPTALLPSAKLVWTPVDDLYALATLTDAWQAILYLMRAGI